MRVSSTMIVIPALMTALGACSAYPTVEEDFGNSVRYMVQRQAINNGPVDTTPVQDTDGERANVVFEIYRTDVSQPEQSAQPVVLDFGSATGQ